MAEDTVKSEENKDLSKNRENKKDEKKPFNNGRNERGSFRPAGGRMQRMPRFKKKVCRFCKNKDLKLDYKKSELIERFLTERGKILPRRITGTCAKHQRRLAIEIKRARLIALLPFVEQ